MTKEAVTVEAELRPEQIEGKIEALDWRDLQLWCIVTVVLAIIAAGFLSFISPGMLGQVSAVLGRQENIKPFFFGLISLLILLNIYLFQQRLVLLKTRRGLIHQLQTAERTARTDPLTAVYNRRFMEETLAREVARAERSHAHLSIMFADVDGFKDFNTQYGHITGDRVLMDVATVLQKNFRSADIVTRYGGDEFVVIMPDTNLVQAAVAVERLAWWMQKWNDQQNREYKIGVTCGVATYTPGLGVEQFLKAADSDLYLHKELRDQRKPYSAANAAKAT